MLTSYHNHSTWSDGTASIREMALAARDAGITEFGISDHLVLAPNDVVAENARLWSMEPNRLADYVQEALEVKDELETREFRFRIGVEADYFDETIGDLKAKLVAYPLDYVIGACHYSGDFPIDHSAELWEPLDTQARHQVWEVYLRKLLGLCAAGCFDFVAHLDLPKKFGEFLPAALAPLMEEVLRAVAKTGLSIEINTAGWDKPCQECYPSEALLRRAVELNIPLLVNADAHATSQTRRHFPEAYSILKSLGVKQVCEFIKRQRQMIPVP
ncbi:MAG: histidinol-phosphatase [Victivallales bacterium]|nr:histidinol-phosphatase [Victivallales bacterium]